MPIDSNHVVVRGNHEYWVRQQTDISSGLEADQIYLRRRHSKDEVACKQYFNNAMPKIDKPLQFTARCLTSMEDWVLTTKSDFRQQANDHKTYSFTPAFDSNDSDRGTLESYNLAITFHVVLGKLAGVSWSHTEGITSPSTKFDASKMWAEYWANRSHDHTQMFNKVTLDQNQPRYHYSEISCSVPGLTTPI